MKLQPRLMALSLRDISDIHIFVRSPVIPLKASLFILFHETANLETFARITITYYVKKKLVMRLQLYDI